MPVFMHVQETDEGGGPSLSEEEMKQRKTKAVMSWLVWAVPLASSAAFFFSAAMPVLAYPQAWTREILTKSACVCAAACARYTAIQMCLI